MDVYVDITNTYSVRLNTGVQRVTKELMWRLAGPDRGQDRLNFIPIVYYDRLSLWKRINRRELAFLCGGMAEPNWFRLSKLLSPFHLTSFQRQIPAGTLFLDMDSSWHNLLKRRSLFRRLHTAGTRIVRLHYDLVPVRFPQYCHEKTLRKYLDHLAACLTYASLFICISRSAQKDLLNLVEEHDLSGNFHTEVLRLGADFSLQQEKSQQKEASVKPGTRFDPEKESGMFILCVGTLEPRKNHSLLIDVFEKIHSRFPWVKLVLIGERGWHVDGLVRRIREHPLYGKALFWFTSVDDEELHRYYEHCLLTVVPSLYEGYGLSVVESLMKGKVTICSTGGSLPEAGGGYADYFDPASSEALETLMAGYLSFPEKRRKREEEIATFRPCTWDESASDLRKILNDFLSKKAAKG